MNKILLLILTFFLVNGSCILYAADQSQNVINVKNNQCPLVAPPHFSGCTVFEEGTCVYDDIRIGDEHWVCKCIRPDPEGSPEDRNWRCKYEPRH